MKLLTLADNGENDINRVSPPEDPFIIIFPFVSNWGATLWEQLCYINFRLHSRLEKLCPKVKLFYNWLIKCNAIQYNTTFI